jgi:hypothetical protein
MDWASISREVRGLGVNVTEAHNTAEVDGGFYLLLPEGLFNKRDTTVSLVYSKPSDLR